MLQRDWVGRFRGGESRCGVLAHDRRGHAHLAESQSNPDGLQNRAILDDSKVKIRKIEQVKLDGKARKTVYSIKGQGLKMKAKHFEKTAGVRADWGEVIVDVLKFCLMTKYEQSESFRDELSRSGDRFIVEDQSTFPKPADTYGAKLSKDGATYDSPNLMGRLLMELRDNGKLEYRLPEGILSFSDLK